MSIAGKQIALAAGLAALGWCSPGTDLIEPSPTEPLRPHAIVSAEDDRLTDALQTQYGIGETEPGWSTGGTRTDQERNASYRQRFPYPSVTFERTDKSGPLSGYGPGIEAVWAYQREWVSDSPEHTKRMLWRWEPPADIRRSYPAWCGHGGKERYKFLCLYPTAYRGKWDRDPVLLCFDSTSGLRWRTALPVVSDPGIALPPVSRDHRGYFSPSPDVRGHMGSTPDGERSVVFLYPYPDRDMAWMYVLDDAGEIVRALVLPDRIGTSAPFPYGGVIRCGGKGAFIVGFRRKLPGTAEGSERETYLIDRDGNFLRKFVDEDGRPVHVTNSGERYALAGRPGKNGGWEHMIYKLP